LFSFLQLEWASDLTNSGPNIRICQSFSLKQKHYLDAYQFSESRDLATTKRTIKEV